MDPGYKTGSSLSLGVEVTQDLRGNCEPELIDQHRLDRSSSQNGPSLNVQELCPVVFSQNPYGLGKVYACVSNDVRFGRLKRDVALSLQPFCLTLQFLFSFLCCENDRLPPVLPRVQHGMFQIDLSSPSYNCPDGFTLPFRQEIP